MRSINVILSLIKAVDFVVAVLVVVNAVVVALLVFTCHFILSFGQ